MSLGKRFILSEHEGKLLNQPFHIQGLFLNWLGVFYGQFEFRKSVDFFAFNVFFVVETRLFLQLELLKRLFS